MLRHWNKCAAFDSIMASHLIFVAYGTSAIAQLRICWP
jgi:hypothetical protein